MDILMTVWSYFATNILQQPAFMIGLIVMVGYILLGKPWYDTLGGTLKAIVGYLILTVGSGGLTNNFRPVLVGLKDRFNMDAMVIDPYFGQNAVTVGVEEVFGKGFGDAMILLFIAFIVNILLVRFTKYTKMRALFTTGNVQVQQAATAYWLIMFACPALLTNRVGMLIVMALLLGAYWAVGSNLTIKPCQEVTDGAGFCLAHQQMFGVAFFYWLAGKLFGNENKKNKGKKVKRIEDIELPGFMSMFNDNMVSASILMLAFFGAILCVLGRDYLIEGGQTMNPSTEDMLNAIEKVNAKTIYIFPNNKNIILAANQARDLTEDKEIIVVPTKTIPQGISAMISFVPEKGGEENLASMTDAISRVKTGQITYAVRDTRIDDKEIHEGDIMGIGDAGILAVGRDRLQVAEEMVAEMVDEESEIISVYYGEDVSEEDAEALSDSLTEKYPECEVELNQGGQPIYYYLISVE